MYVIKVDVFFALNHQESAGCFQNELFSGFGGLQLNRNIGGLRILVPAPHYGYVCKR
jgi:hypothetical protein